MFTGIDFVFAKCFLLDGARGLVAKSGPFLTRTSIADFMSLTNMASCGPVKSV